MRVTATRQMFDGTSLRQPGDEFDLPDSTKLDPETDPFKKVDPRAPKKAASQDESGDSALA